jgi:hypothetical protein
METEQAAETITLWLNFGKVFWWANNRNDRAKNIEYSSTTTEKLLSDAMPMAHKNCIGPLRTLVRLWLGCERFFHVLVDRVEKNSAVSDRVSWNGINQSTGNVFGKTEEPNHETLAYIIIR